MDDSLRSSREDWSGVVRAHGASKVVCMAHGEKAELVGNQLEPERLVAIYDVRKLYLDDSKAWQLQWTSTSVAIYIPEEPEKIPCAIKEVCAGMGGIAQGLEAVGFSRMAAMDCNPLMCETLKKNGTPWVVLGDVLVEKDRATLHMTPSPLRCLIASGFPCQPLSSQGDRKGQADLRSRPFFAVLKLAWEQQCSALLLENVKGAMEADYIQEGLQRLSWSLGMDLSQTILNLDRTWPCRRTRWWALVKPTEYKLHHIPDLPEDPLLKVVGQLLPLWPRWDGSVEEDLHLTEYELEIMRDKRFGSDHRQIARDDVVPCFLHSYSTSLRSCPCGCRSSGFSAYRLERDGVRGFYVVSMVTGQQRWLHPREAALLCGLDPQMALPADLRAGLCLVGQCASPLQAAWMGTHLMDAAQGQSGTPQKALTLYKMWLLRQAHGMVPKKAPMTLQIADGQDGTQITMNLSGTTKVAEILAAEHRLQGGGEISNISDVYGRLPHDYDITQGAVVGSLTLQHRQKRQRKILEPKQIVVMVKTKQMDGTTSMHHMEVKAGIFVFEVMSCVPGVRHVFYKGIMDDEGNEWRLDERILQPVTFVHFQIHHEVCAWGNHCTGEKGLGNECIDRCAKWMLREMELVGRSTWIPAIQCSLLVLHTEDAMINHWLVAALHGVLRGCAVIAGHWVYLEMNVTGNLMKVICWDGLDHQARHEILVFAEKARRILVVRTLVVSFNAEYSQQSQHTCGTIALMHHGHAIGFWKDRAVPDEEEWHAILQCFNEGSLYGEGRLQGDDQLVLELREVLQHHGVPTEKTEERASLAIKKMGAGAIEKALRNRNPWMALKALGSQPKINYLWVKPDELEKQIKFRAHSKYKASVSERKKDASQAASSRVIMDPKSLALVPGTFVSEDGRDVTQLEIESVAADKAGVAFGTLEDVSPFLREDKSITMDALAILTVAPVPPSSQGLMPVTNLRFPATYVPTKEIVLIEGSLVQLGDCSVARKQDAAIAALQTIDTRTFKITVWRDEWQGNWKDFVSAPVRKVIETMPRLMLCKGDRCGPGCKRFHAPVDCELDQVVVDLWNRGWYGGKGKRTAPEEAELFQVLMRIPNICSEGLQSRSGQDGIYLEPRKEDGKSPAEDFVVVWLPGAEKAEAQHRLKVCDRGVALVRFGSRFGIRVMSRDAEALHREIFPDRPYQQVNVQSVYEIRPVPYGVQTAGVRELLKQWGWKAKVLQPYKADQHGQGWLVGAETPPPMNVFQTSNGDVLVTVHKRQTSEKAEQVILAPTKTKTFLRKTPGRASRDEVNDKENIMPWNGLDPWGGYNKFSDGRDQETQPGRSSKMGRLHDQMHEVVENSLKDATEQRFLKLETGITELREQNQKFETWFGEAGQSTAALRQDVNILTNQVKENQQNINTLSGEIRSGFANLESLLAKKQRQE